MSASPASLRVRSVQCTPVEVPLRYVLGTSAATVKAARELGLSTQINTTVSRHNIDDFENLIELMGRVGISLWSVFFLVPTGRAKAQDIASPEEFERVFERMYELSKTAPFDIKSTAAPVAYFS